MSLLNFSSLRKMVAPPDLALDLGTANTRLYARGRGLIVDEPSLLKLESSTNQIEAYGATAVKLASIDPQAHYFSPLHAGVVTDIEAAGAMIKVFLQRSWKLGLWPQRALTFASTDACEIERTALVKAARIAGLSEVAVIPKPLAAAIGAGLDVALPYAQMIVEMGAGVTDIALVQAGEITRSSALRLACNDLHQAVSQNVAGRYGILLYPREAERLTQEIGATNQSEVEREFITTGIDLLSGRSVCLGVTSFDILFAVESLVENIVDNIAAFVEQLPADIACEVIEGGICLTGGGALLKGFAERVSLATQLDVVIAHDPMRAVINGAREMLQVGEKTGIWQNQ
jgi:rod shape-determining protein MreB